MATQEVCVIAHSQTLIELWIVLLSPTGQGHSERKLTIGAQVPLTTIVNIIDGEVPKMEFMDKSVGNVVVCRHFFVFALSYFILGNDTNRKIVGPPTSTGCFLANTKQGLSTLY